MKNTKHQYVISYNNGYTVETYGTLNQVKKEADKRLAYTNANVTIARVISCDGLGELEDVSYRAWHHCPNGRSVYSNGYGHYSKWIDIYRPVADYEYKTFKIRYRMNEDTNLQISTQPPLVIADVSSCPSIRLINADCMEVMKTFEDKQFDLAIVDPPYGLNFGAFNRTNKDSNGNRYKANKYHNAAWDKETPQAEYWEQLFRVSKNQIVWGGTTFRYRLHNALYFGISRTQLQILLMENWRGLHLKNLHFVLITDIMEGYKVIQVQKLKYTLHKSQHNFTSGF